MYIIHFKTLTKYPNWDFWYANIPFGNRDEKLEAFKLDNLRIKVARFFMIQHTEA
jgi:hypothetical protein